MFNINFKGTIKANVSIFMKQVKATQKQIY